ncbi:MAG: c-type cytochrome [Myxococcota bacterium]
MLPILLLIACGPGESLSPEAARGKQVYQTHCTSCHHADPAKTGPVGPAIKGSSRELLEARVIRGEYPPGYTPKRTTTLMPALPQLKDDVHALAAYLQ